MAKIKSKFSWVHVYLTFIVLLFIYGGMLAGVIFAYFSSDLDVYQYIFWIVLLSVLFVLSMLSFFKMAKTITITNQSIVLRTVFKRQEFHWTEIKAIQLHGKEDWLFSLQEATTLFLKNGKKFFFLNKLYRNTPLIKSALNTVKRQGLRGKSIDIENLKQHSLKKRSQKMPNYSLTKYSGNFWWTINGVTLLIFLSFWVFSFWLLLNNNVVFGGLLLIWCFIFGILAILVYQLNYFYVGKHHLVVRNHIWRPYTQVYHLEDIEEVVFDSIGYNMNGLRVITKDFKSSFFPAESLSDKTWKKLKKALRKRKVEIRF